MAESTTLVGKADVQKAKSEIDRMKRSLSGWLKYRTLNDAVVAGTAPTSKPRAYAREVVLQSRDMAAEQQLAKQLYVLLAESLPGVQLPDPNVTANPQAAVQLAMIAIHGPAPSSPQAQGAWYTSWPLLVVGGLLLAITTAIKSSADVTKEKERLACIQAGACTDSGFFLKVGGVALLVWVAWQMGLHEKIKGAFKSK
jgi:hypothetical protein